MTDPKWIISDTVESLHQEVLKRGGGLTGMLSQAGLEAALHRPKEHYYYGEEDLFQLAAIYTEGIIRNHPYCDGNKRTAFFTADMFLFCNGYDLDKEVEDEHLNMVLQLTERAITRQEFADHLRKSSRLKAPPSNKPN